jgi:hypothetical protein
MRSVVVPGEESRLTLVVKKIKGRLYVYEQYRAGGKVETRYIGPLEEMARVYQIYKSLGKVEKLTKRDLRRLARIILEEYEKRQQARVVKTMENTRSSIKEVISRSGSRWWTGRDLNPGPPPCEGGALPG